MSRAKQKAPRVTTSRRRRLTPREARTLSQLCQLENECVFTSRFWIQVSVKGVTLAEQRSGEKARGLVTIDRKLFDRFVDWYNTGELPKRKKRLTRPAEKGA